MTGTDSSAGLEPEAPASPALSAPLSSDESTKPAQPTAPRPPSWRVLRVFGYSAVVLAVGLAAQLVTMIALVVVAALREPGLDVDARLATIGSDGHALCVSTIASSLVCAPVVAWLSRGRAPGRAALLGFVGVRPRVAVGWVAGALALSLCADALWTALGRSFMTEEWIAIATSTESFALLLVALSIAAPVVEELLFRGLLLEGLRASGVATWLAVAMSSAGWTVIHLQYELPELTVIFALGLMLGLARVSTGSIVPPLLAHAAWNAMSWAQLLQLQAP